MRDVARRWRCLVACFSLLLCLGVSATAQTNDSSASLKGVVTDPEGKAVVNATVLIRNEASLASADPRTTMTDATGRFAVSGLLPGAYKIEVAVPGFDLVERNGVVVSATGGEEIAIRLTVANISETVTVSAALPEAAVAAPSQSSLTARSAQSLISPEYIRSYTSPVSDYSQVLQMAPGTFSTSTNGAGLGDTKTFFRGFKDGQYSMTYDGIPFNDTNDPTHHSWVFFPAQTIGSTIFDRSPGSGATVGPSTYVGSVMLLHSNTPNQKGSTRAQIAQFGDNFLMTGDPNSPLYYKFNFYRIPTDFEYVGVRTTFGSWSIDNKSYTMYYYNKQNFNGLTSITATSATDKLNSYRKVGNLLPIQQVSNFGVFRTGLWSEYAWTDRYQTPSDPRTWVDAALPNFHEKFITTTMQPYAEYELQVAPKLRIIPGMKLAYYKQDFTQFADNRKTVG